MTTPETLAPTVKKDSFNWGIFTPNVTLSSTIYYYLIVAEVIVAFVLWTLMPAIIPSPLEIVASLQDLITEGGLVGELWSSLTTSLEAIAISTVISMALAYGSTMPVVRVIAAAISKLRFLSMVGISFLLTLYVGGGQPLKIALLVFGLTPFMTTSMLDVVLQVPTDMLDYVRTLRAGKWRVVYEAQILGTLGTMFDIVRQNAAMGWLLLTFVEGMVRSEGGIGKMLLDEQKHFSLAAIFAIQFVFLLVGIAQDYIIVWFKGWFAPSSMLAYNKEK